MRFFRTLQPYLIRLGLILSFLFIGITLLLFVRGDYDHGLEFQHGFDTKVESPFESSNSTSRYVLTQAIVDNHTFALDDVQAKAASPDLVKYKKTYLSIFTPGVSFLGIPFYMFGEKIGAPQLSAYTLTLLLALLNVFLIFRLVHAITKSTLIGVLSGSVFLFATNALVYALTYTQHHASITFLLLMLDNIRYERNWKTNTILGMLFAFSILIDIPNAFLGLPILLYGFIRNFAVSKVASHIEIRIKPLIVMLGLGMLPFICLFAFYNHSLTGSFTKIGQFIGRYDYPDPNAPKLPPPEVVPTSSTELVLVHEPFNTRVELEGLHILLLSKQRSWLFYSPIVLVGILGCIILYRKKEWQIFGVVMISSIVLNVILYSSFDDPWGGWAFGPRYLLPAAALLCVGIGVLLSWLQTKTHILRLIAFCTLGLLLMASINTTFLGALTTAAIPPRGEAEALMNDTPWTTEYNFRFLKKNESSSLLYNAYFSMKMTAEQYDRYLTTISSAILIAVLGIVLIHSQKDQTN